MLNAGTALIKAISSQQSTTLADRKAMEQKINAIKTKISKIDSHKQTLDKSADSHSISSVMNTIKSKVSDSRHGKILFDSQKPTIMETLDKAAKSPTGKMIEGKIMDRIEGKMPASTTTESFTLPSSLQGQEEDTRIQLKSSYSYYTVWFVIAVLLIVVMFSNIFMDKKEGGEGEEGGEGGEDSSSVMSSTTLMIGVLIMIVFIYFVVQYILSYFNISRPDLPFDNINPLM
jgi:preprotein translocase subunit SecG